MHLETWQWVVAVLGAFSLGLGKGGLTGVGTLAVPLFALILPPRQSVGTVLLVLIAADVVAVAFYRRHAVWAHLVRICPWAAAGVVLGFLAVGHIDDRQIGHVIGAILVALILFQYWRGYATRHHTETEAIMVPKTPLLTAAAGITAGFTTMMANAAGPIMSLYLLAQRLPKMEFVGTAAWYFLLLNAFKVPFALENHMIVPAGAAISMRLMPAGIAGVVSARFIIRYVNQKFFQKIVLSFALIASLWLLCGQDLWGLVARHH